MEIKVGDTVTWRAGKSRAKNVMPLGIANCKVLEIGEDEAGKPVARLQLPLRFHDMAEGECNGYVADLEK